MKFYQVTGETTEKSAVLPEYKEAREFGAVRVGKTMLFFRKGRKTYCMSYPEISRFFRRVMLVPAKMCCASGKLPVESLVLCRKTAASEEAEVVQVTLPGSRAAKLLMELLKEKMPETPSAAPGKSEEKLESKR